MPALAIAAALCLGGCASVPPLDPAPLPRTQASLAANEAFGGAAGTWPSDSWWRAYGDPQLDALMAEALAGSPTYVAARARIRRAEAIAEQAGSSRLPELSADASGATAKQSYHNGIPPLFVPKGYHDNGRATLGLNWDLDPWGRNRDALAAATSDALAAQADAAEARRTLTAAIASTYADLYRGYEDRDAALETARVRAETLSLVALRQTNGLETRGALKQNTSAERGAQADVLAANESIALAKDRLASLLGAGPDRGLNLNRPVIGRPPTVDAPQGLAMDLVARRPDVIAARLRIESARRRVDQARKDFYPNLNLAGFIGAQALDLRDLTRAGSDIGNLGLATHLPIFEAGRLQGAYRANRADYDAAVANYDAALVNAVQEVADALNSRRATAARLDRTTSALAAANDAYEVALDRYEAGLSPYLSVLSAQDAVITNRRAVADLKARVFSLDVALIRGLGGGYRDTGPQTRSGSVNRP